MASIPELRDRFKTVARVSDNDDIEDTEVESWIVDAIAEHNSAYSSDGSDLPAREVPLVFLLTQIQLCLLRANTYSAQPSLSGGQGYGQDRDTPFKKQMEMIAMLRKEYERKCVLMGIVQNPDDDGNTIVQGALTRVDTDLPIRVPYANDPTPIRPIRLTLVSKDATSVVLSWNKSRDEIFKDYILFYQTVAEGVIYDATNWSSHTGVPYVVDTAIKIFDTNDPDNTSVKVQGLTTGIALRFMIVCRNDNFKVAYSAPLDVTPS